MHNSLEDLEKSVNTSLLSENLEEALKTIESFVLNIINFPHCVGVLYSSKLLDNLCQKIGHIAWQKNISLNLLPLLDKELVVYVASYLYTSGGHTAVIKDLITFQPEKKHVILITNIQNSNKKQQRIILDHFKLLDVELIYSPFDLCFEKLQWIQNQLRNFNPGRIFLFNHNQDSVAVAAIQPMLDGELFFYHHADHSLSLGVHLEHLLHIDPHPFGLFNCRCKLGVKNNIYWPLSTPCYQETPLEEKDFLSKGQLRTSSSGSENKFTTSYIYSYLDLIPQLLFLTKGTHTHIGPLEEKNLDKIRDKMAALDIPKDNFIHIPWTHSIWQAMVDHKIDLYISSFPYGGLKACIEVMGSGTPVIFHQNYISQVLGGSFGGYPEAFIWKNPSELFKYITSLNKTDLTYLSKLAREHYNKNYQPNILKEELKKTQNEMKGVETTPLDPFEPDYFQISLDIIREFNKVYTSNSWRITAPLRKFIFKYNKLKKAVLDKF